MAAYPQSIPVYVYADVCGDSVTVQSGQIIVWQNHNAQQVACSGSGANWPLTVTSWTVPAAQGSNPGTYNTDVKSIVTPGTYTYSRTVCTSGSGKIVVQSGK